MASFVATGLVCVAAEPAGQERFAEIQDILSASCADCHEGDEPEGEFSLTSLGSPESLTEHAEEWMKARQRIIDRSMPPKDMEPLEDSQRDLLSEWIDKAVVDAICEQGPQAGPPVVRRLTRQEYAHTIRDLLNVFFDASEGLPEDGAGGEGFTNAAETLSVSPDHADRYLVAAGRSLEYAFKDERSRQMLLPLQPNDYVDEAECASFNLRKLAERAYRRPVSRNEIDALVDLYRTARADDRRFDEAMLYAMQAILVSPDFLFLTQRAPKSADQVEPLTSHELATRLSYFLWATMPDRELRRASDSGALANVETVRAYTRRMLRGRSTRLRDSMSLFVGQWLGTADLGKAKKVDQELHGWIEEPHEAAMRNQPVYALETIIRENRSLMELVDAPWTHLNKALLKLYQIPESEFKGKKIEGYLTRVDLPKKYRFRGGLLGMGGIHTVSSYPRRSSPVLRGAWVLEKMLGVELPPPPPEVPALEESEEAKVSMTLRERLEQHRANPTCASCHDRMDPLGFALENFDEIGRWRDKDEGGPIDPLAVLADGTEINGLDGLKSHLLEHRVEFVRHLTRKMLGYALGRALLPSDRCTIEKIVKRLQENGFRSHELIYGIVESVPFRMKR